MGSRSWGPGVTGVETLHGHAPFRVRRQIERGCAVDTADRRIGLARTGLDARCGRHDSPVVRDARSVLSGDRADVPRAGRGRRPPWLDRGASAQPQRGDRCRPLRGTGQPVRGMAIDRSWPQPPRRPLPLTCGGALSLNRADVTAGPSRMDAQDHTGETGVRDRMPACGRARSVE
jgi:hypothetical protein